MSIFRQTEEWLAARTIAKRPSVDVVHIELPWPPTVNHIYTPRGSNAGGRRLSPEAKNYRADVAVRCVAANVGHLEGRLRLVIHASPPDRRRRDLDNLQKSVLDALEHAGIYADDCAIDDLRILRVAGKPGTVLVFIERIGP